MLRIRWVFSPYIELRSCTFQGALAETMLSDLNGLSYLVGALLPLPPPLRHVKSFRNFPCIGFSPIFYVSNTNQLW